MDIPAILDTIRNGAAWAMLGPSTDYAALDWRDDVQNKPTEQEIIDAWPAVEAAINVENALVQNAKARNLVADMATLKNNIVAGGIPTLAADVAKLTQIVSDLMVLFGFQANPAEPTS